MRLQKIALNHVPDTLPTRSYWRRSTINDQSRESYSPQQSNPVWTGPKFDPHPPRLRMLGERRAAGGRDGSGRRECPTDPTRVAQVVRRFHRGLARVRHRSTNVSRECASARPFHQRLARVVRPFHRRLARVVRPFTVAWRERCDPSTDAWRVSRPICRRLARVSRPICRRLARVRDRSPAAWCEWRDRSTDAWREWCDRSAAVWPVATRPRTHCSTSIGIGRNRPKESEHSSVSSHVVARGSPAFHVSFGSLRSRTLRESQRVRPTSACRRRGNRSRREPRARVTGRESRARVTGRESPHQVVLHEERQYHLPRE